jgi:hypothetical protein
MSGAVWLVIFALWGLVCFVIGCAWTAFRSNSPFDDFDGD